MTSVWMPPGQQTFFDLTGKPLSLGSIELYIPTTYTPKLSWADEAQSVVNQNPLPLDASGSAPIWGIGLYRMIAKDEAGATVFDKITGFEASGGEGGSVFGPDISVSGHVATWASTDGTQIADGGIPLANLALTNLSNVAGAVDLTLSGYLTVGEPEDTGGAANGGIYLGGPTGIWLKQEGFIADNEQGAWSAYPLVPDRWCGLSISPSGDPWDLPNENITSLGLQILNGASEERIVFTAKWFGDEATGYGEYRIAPIQTGTGRFWPLTITNNDKYYVSFGVLAGGLVEDITRFTNQHIDGSSGGNTVIAIDNPGATAAMWAFVRPGDNECGIARFTSGVSAYEVRWDAGGLVSTGYLATLAKTVAALTPAATAGAGARDFVTDATTTVILGLGLAVVGGGSNKVPVYSDGAAWIIG